MTDYLMRIVVNEQQQEKKEQTYKAVLSYLWEQGAPGATMRRGDAGIDHEGNLRFDFLEDVYYNNLPIIIESILDGAVIQKLEGGLKSLVKHGQISISKGFDEGGFNDQEYFIVKVYTSEKKKLLKKEEYEKILSFLRSKNVIWATVTKGIAGYGRDHVIYSQHLFPLSEHMPLVVECIVDKDNHSSLIEELRQVITEGAVISLPVDLILNRQTRGDLISMYYLYIAIFGGLGAAARYWISNVLEAGLFPYNTLLINLIGCFLLAVIFRYFSTFPRISSNLITGIGTGFIGSFTTFSAFSLQTAHFILDKHYLLSVLYIGASFVGGFLSAGLGVFVSNKLIARKESKEDE